MLWDLYQQGQINSAMSAASRAQGQADRVQVQIRQLEARIDGLALISQAMWELLTEGDVNAEQRLIDKIREVDLRDGKEDGKMNRVQRRCSDCDRPLHHRHTQCIYCGTEMARENLFQS